MRPHLIIVWLCTHHRVSSHPSLHADHFCPVLANCDLWLVWVTAVVTGWTGCTDTTGQLEYFDINWASCCSAGPPRGADGPPGPREPSGALPRSVPARLCYGATGAERCERAGRRGSITGSEISPASTARYQLYIKSWLPPTPASQPIAGQHYGGIMGMRQYQSS